MASTADSPAASPSSNASNSHNPNERPRLPIRTYHCSFCKQILLATTRDVSRLPRRGGDGLDKATILPLKSRAARKGGKERRKERVKKDLEQDEGEEDDDDEEDDEETASSGGHYTILLSTTSPSSTASIVRRQDGFEKRLMLRCGRCRVICGYVLDNVHFPDRGTKREEGGDHGDSSEEEGENGGDDDAEVVYILPGAVVETGDMRLDTENKVDRKEWEGWERLIPAS